MRSFLGVRVAIGSVKHLLQCSPLARGNQALQCGCAGGGGPIPARAGQPVLRQHRSRTKGAYPRSRGATAPVSDDHMPLKGLSPLARGNLQQHHASLGWQGPIPARAGQPKQQERGRCTLWAYPRSRGATGRYQSRLPPVAGLSPLARGNLQAQRVRVERLGPIPARAGQPPASARLAMAHKAYPRSRGATTMSCVLMALV